MRAARPDFRSERKHFLVASIQIMTSERVSAGWEVLNFLARPGKIGRTLGKLSVASEVTLVPQKKWKLFLCPQVHLDMGYTDYRPMLMKSTTALLIKVIAMMEAHPDYKFNPMGRSSSRIMETIGAKIGASVVSRSSGKGGLGSCPVLLRSNSGWPLRKNFIAWPTSARASAVSTNSLFFTLTRQTCPPTPGRCRRFLGIWA